MPIMRLLRLQCPAGTVQTGSFASAGFAKASRSVSFAKRKSNKSHAEFGAAGRFPEVRAGNAAGRQDRARASGSETSQVRASRPRISALSGSWRGHRQDGVKTFS